MCHHTCAQLPHVKHPNSIDLRETRLARICRNYVHNTVTLLYCVSPRQYLEE